MADKTNLNPGDQRYHDLVNRSGNLASAESQAANDYSHDYSRPANYAAGETQRTNGGSALAQIEQSAAQQAGSSGNDSDDLGTQERSASYQTVGFNGDGGLNRRTVGSSAKRSKKFGRFKKFAIGGSLGLVGGGAIISLFLSASMLLQPVQHASNLMWMGGLNSVNAQQSVRAMTNAGTIADSGGNGIKRNSLIKTYANRQSKAMTERLAKNGVTLSRKGFEIDISGKSKSEVASLMKSLDVKKASVSGDKIHVPRDISYTDARKVIKTFDDPGKFNVRPWLQGRVALKQHGYTSWLHPFQKLKQKAADTLEDFVSKLVSKFRRTDSSVGSKIDNEASPPKDETGTPNSSSTISQIKEKADTSYNRKGKLRSKLGEAKESLLSKFSLGAFNPIGAAFIVVGVVCLFHDIGQQAGPYKWTQVVIPAMAFGSLLLGIASQVKSGSDIDLDHIRKTTEWAYGAKINNLDQAGNETGETTFSTIQQSDVFCHFLDPTSCAGNSASNVPDSLRAVSQRTNWFGNQQLNEIINTIAGTNGSAVNGVALDVLCFFFSIAENLFDSGGVIFRAVVNAIGGVINDFVVGKIGEALTQVGFVSWLLQMAANWLFGEAINTETASPAMLGSIAAFGVVFMAINQTKTTGGARMSTQAAREVRLEEQRYMAWEQSRKPVVARLLDPVDSMSGINILARSINADNSSLSIGTQLANAVKVFTSAPAMLATASGQLLGGSAYAASSYDFGVGTYGWTVDEMNKLSSGDGQYDMEANTNDVLTLLNNEDEHPEIYGNRLHQYAEKCFSARIANANSDFKVTIVSNEDGTAWNFVDNGSDDCAASPGTDEFKVRLYLNDYFNTVGGMCYEGSGDDSSSSAACNEMGVQSSGSSSKASASSWNGKSGQELLSEFNNATISKTGTQGDWDGAFGRQCVDLTMWFVQTFTNLKWMGCNGNSCASNLASANGGTVTNTPVAPAVFSVDAGTMGTISSYGHTGIVLKVDDDGTIHTIETGSANNQEKTYTPSQYQGARFFNLGEYIKQ